MDLYLYSPDIELQGVIDGYSSLRWRRRFFEPGEFELHCPATDSNIALLREGNILHRLDRDGAGIIEGIAIATADNGGDEITATGRMGSSQLDRRIVTPTINFTGTVKTAMRKAVSDNAITARPLPHLILGVQNLFDKSAVTNSGQYVDFATGNYITNPPYCVSAYIPVAPNTTYYASHMNLNHCQYDDSRNFIKPMDSYGNGGDDGYYFTTYSNTHYIRISVPKANLDIAQFEPYHSAACAFQVTYKTVLAVCEALGKAAPLGFRVRLDVPNKQWVFEVYDGVDRSAGQTARPQVVFCSENGNISKPSYARDSTGYANYAIVGGEGDGAARVIVEVDQTGGEPRRELWVDAKDQQNTEDTSESFSGDGNTASFALAHTPSSVSSVTVGSSAASYSLNGSTITISPAPEQGASISVSYAYKKLSDAAYAAQLQQRGMEKLAGAARSESFSADAVDTGNYKYLTDWDLGDIVSFEKWGIRIDERITEVEEVYENGVETVTPTCGSPLPETLDLGSDT
jgi:hypothetical protein